MTLKPTAYVTWSPVVDGGVQRPRTTPLSELELVVSNLGSAIIEIGGVEFEVYRDDDSPAVCFQCSRWARYHGPTGQLFESVAVGISELRAAADDPATDTFDLWHPESSD